MLAALKIAEGEVEVDSAFDGLGPKLLIEGPKPNGNDVFIRTDLTDKLGVWWNTDPNQPGEPALWIKLKDTLVRLVAGRLRTVAKNTQTECGGIHERRQRGNQCIKRCLTNLNRTMQPDKITGQIKRAASCRNADASFEALKKFKLRKVRTKPYGYFGKAGMRGANFTKYLVQPIVGNTRLIDEPVELRTLSVKLLQQLVLNVSAA